MAIRENETEQQRARRHAAMLRNSLAQRAQGIKPGMGDMLPWVKAAELVGVTFEIVSIEYDVPNKLNPASPQTVLTIELVDGTNYKLSAPVSMQKQLERMDEETLQDNLYTVAEGEPYKAYGKTQIPYFLDWPDSDIATPVLPTRKPEPNTPAKNRARVFATRNAKQASSYFDDEDTSEDEDEDVSTEDEIAPVRRGPGRPKGSGKSNTSVTPTNHVNPLASKKSVAPKAALKGSGIEVTGNGKYTMGRGRPPADAVHFNSSNGVFYDADGKKLKSVAGK